MATEQKPRPPKPSEPGVGMYDGAATASGRAAGNTLEQFGYRPPEGNWQRTLGNWFGGIIENSLQRDAQWEAERLVAQYNDAVFRRDNGYTPEERLAAAQEADQVREKYANLEEYMQTGASGARALGALVDTPGLYSQFNKISAGYPGAFEGELPKLPTETEGPQLPGVPEQPAVGTYEQPAAAQTGLGVISPLSTQAPGLGNYGAPSGSAQDMQTQPFKPTAASAVIPDTGMGGVIEGAYAGDVVGGQTPFVNEFGQPIVGPMGGLQEGAYTGDIGGGTTVSPFTGPDAGAGRYTPIETEMQYGRFRGFRNYPELMAAMEESGRSGRPYERYEMRDMYDNKYSAADSLKAYLSEGYYGGMDNIQRADLGQGIQDYRVRRDAYGNIKSYTPAGSRTQKWHPPYAPQY